MFSNIVDSVKAVANRFTAPVTGDEHADKAAVDKVTGKADEAHYTAQDKVRSIRLNYSDTIRCPLYYDPRDGIMGFKHADHEALLHDSLSVTTPLHKYRKICESHLIFCYVCVCVWRRPPIEVDDVRHTLVRLQAEQAKGQVKSSWNEAKGQAQDTVDDAKDRFKSNFSEDTRAKAEQSKNKAAQAADDASDSIRVRAEPLSGKHPSVCE